MSDDGPAPIDPDFAALFREPETTSTPDVDTGRLFRSQGVAGHDDAVLALASDRFGRLRTLARTDDTAAAAEHVPPADPEAADGLDQDPAAAEPDAEPAESPGEPESDAEADAPAVPAVVGGGVPDSPVDPVPATPATAAVTVPPRAARGDHRARTITAGAAYLIVIGLTVLVGFVNALLSGGTLGWPTGLALLVSSTYAALTIRRSDLTVAVIVPPIAFALAALTAGQAFLGASANSLLNRAVVWFFTLAGNWPWIIGSTLVALAIVVVRGRRRSGPR